MRSRAIAACARVHAASLVAAGDCAVRGASGRPVTGVFDSDPLTPPAPCVVCDARFVERPPPMPFDPAAARCGAAPLVSRPRAPALGDRGSLDAVVALLRLGWFVVVESDPACGGFAVAEGEPSGRVARPASDPLLPAALSFAATRDRSA